MCQIAGMRTTRCGEFNPGGYKRVWLIADDAFKKARVAWPSREHTKVNGVLSGTIVFAPVFTTEYAPEFVEFEVADNSCKVVCNASFLKSIVGN